MDGVSGTTNPHDVDMTEPVSPSYSDQFSDIPMDVDYTQIPEDKIQEWCSTSTTLPPSMVDSPAGPLQLVTQESEGATFSDHPSSPRYTAAEKGKGKEIQQGYALETVDFSTSPLSSHNTVVEIRKMKEVQPHKPQESMPATFIETRSAFHSN